MNDPRLAVMSAVLHQPNKPLKVYIEMSSVARATFFKAKANLEEVGVLSFEDGKQLKIDRIAARQFLSQHYPGLVSILISAD